MNLKFTKMEGCGNDYIYFSTFSQQIDDPQTLAVKLADRHNGIGGDGIILVEPSTIADGKMRIFNADGSEGKMCGNGIRCVGKYLYDYGIVQKKNITIETLSGVKTLLLTVHNNKVIAACVDMGPAILSPAKIPVLLMGDSIINQKVTIASYDYYITCVSMGNPHCIVFCKDIMSLDLTKVGPLFVNASIFPEQVNTEFVEIVDDHTIKMRVWERGSGETMACGTGACASVVAATLNGYCIIDEDISVVLLGGTLTIRYTKDTVYMTGPCVTVFEGCYDTN